MVQDPGIRSYGQVQQLQAEQPRALLQGAQ